MLKRAMTPLLAAAATAALIAASVVTAQEQAGEPANRTPDLAGGSVFDVQGDVSIMHGARTASATRGMAVVPGDRVFIQPDSTLVIRCPDQVAQRITAAGSFTFSGCRPPAVAAVQPPAPAAPPVSAAPTAAPTSTANPLPTSTRVATRSGMSGGTLGIIGGVLLLGAAAGGGGGGGGSSSSTSPPLSP
jgi:hypothetical protein